MRSGGPPIGWWLGLILPSLAVMDSESPYARGTIKFFREDKGWGGITSPDVPADVWVLWDVLEGEPGFPTFTAGDRVEFRYEKARQDSWQYRATWVRRLLSVE